MKAKIRKQAQEISYIAIRLAQITNNQELADRTERACLAVVERIYGQKYIESLESIEVLEGIIAYAVNTDQISIENGEELIKRTASLKELIIDGQESIERKLKIDTKLSILPAPHRSRTGQSGKEYNRLPYNKKTQGKKATERRREIIKLLEERGKLQLKDIIASFPQTSPRTVRYDLTHLCENKQILREGSGGPANFYMLPMGITTSKIESNTSQIPSKPKKAENSGIPQATNVRNTPEAVSIPEPPLLEEKEGLGPEPSEGKGAEQSPEQAEGPVEVPELEKTELNEALNPPL